MNARGLRPCPATFGCLAEGLVLNGQPDEALKLICSHTDAEELRSFINTVSYATVLSGFAMAEHDKEEGCTAVMLRNLPNNYSRSMSMEILVTEEFLEEYNFFYLAIDFKSGPSLGFPCPPDSVRSIRELSALKPSSTPTCSQTHHHHQQPPRNPKGEGRWSRRVVSRGSPDLKSGASRPSSSIRCTGKNGENPID